MGQAMFGNRCSYTANPLSSKDWQVEVVGYIASRTDGGWPENVMWDGPLLDGWMTW